MSENKSWETYEPSQVSGDSDVPTECGESSQVSDSEIPTEYGESHESSSKTMSDFVEEEPCQEAAFVTSLSLQPSGSEISPHVPESNESQESHLDLPTSESAASQSRQLQMQESALEIINRPPKTDSTILSFEPLQDSQSFQPIASQTEMSTSNAKCTSMTFTPLQSDQTIVSYTEESKDNVNKVSTRLPSQRRTSFQQIISEIESKKVSNRSENQSSQSKISPTLLGQESKKRTRKKRNLKSPQKYIRRKNISYDAVSENVPVDFFQNKFLSGSSNITTVKTEPVSDMDDDDCASDVKQKTSLSNRSFDLETYHTKGPESDGSSDISQNSTPEHDVRRSSRSCVKKAKAKIKKMAKVFSENEIEPGVINNTETIIQEKKLVKLRKFPTIKLKRKDRVTSAKFEKLENGTFQCSVCWEVFNTNENEQKHCSKHLGSFQCGLCSFSSDNKQLFLNHMNCHEDDVSGKKTKNAKVKTASAEKVKREKLLTSAKFEKLKDGTFQCTLCQDIFDSEEKEEEHCSWHLGFFKCNVCSELFSTETGLKVHLNGKCGDENRDEKSRAFQCKFCAFSCDHKKPFLNHMSKKHNDESYFDKTAQCVCNACGLIFSSRYKLAGHTCSAVSRIWLCAICGEQFTGKQKMKRHRLTHTEKTVKCCMESCDKMYYTQGLMLQHYRRSHQSKKLNFECTYEQCGKKFSHSSCLNQHIESVHLKNRVFMCDWAECGKCFTMEWHLKVHMRIHKGENPIECQFCDYKCRQRASLKWHLRKHGIFNREQEKAALEQLNTWEEISKKINDS